MKVQLEAVTTPQLDVEIDNTTLWQVGDILGCTDCEESCEIKRNEVKFVTVPLVDMNLVESEEVHVSRRVKSLGYPNAYGARIPITTRWKLDELQSRLEGYHDNEIIPFLRYGWPSNRLPGHGDLATVTVNHGSARQHPEFVADYIRKELAAGTIFGPFRHIPFTDRVAISPLSTRPKRDPGERRTIMDLSFPPGRSVNDCIPKDSYLGVVICLKYPTVDQLAMKLSNSGPWYVMWKRDLARYFRQIPIDPADWELFGFQWGGLFYWNKMLVMGHRAAPYIAQRVSNALAYIHSKGGWFVFNYIDDFLGVEHITRAHLAFMQFAEMLEAVGVQESSAKLNNLRT